ncbi:uncharacterized protein LOC120329136 [Styela clava]|uniref:uncharacterized protein LOC120329136 n=1 Tax=Styela clava TaxID=7725 RepID=UPI00193AC0F2|nr:uncharacterized protein LOC120329136 [Styela clava]
MLLSSLFSLAIGTNYVTNRKVDDPTSMKLPVLSVIQSESGSLTQALLFRTLKYSTNKKNSDFISSSKSESKSLKTELPKSTGVVTLIAYYFGEDLNQIFKCFQKETTFSQILEDIPKSPFIACIGNTVATAETFYVIAEREVVCPCRSFFEAVAFQFASFYVFNIEYPKKALLTFDFIQRFFGDINPRVTKSKKSKGKDVHAKVIGLARRVNLSQALYVPLLEIDV